MKTYCANSACGMEHRGPRSTEDMHHEAGRILQRAAEMQISDARDYLRVQFLRMGLELSSYCPNCVLNTQVSVGAVASESLQAVRETEQAMAAVTETGQHICVVLPFRKPEPKPFYEAVQPKGEAP